MEWIQVSSSAISRVAYHNGELYIDWKFEGGNDVYAYRVPESVFRGLLAAGSKGAYANGVVKQYPCRQI